MKEVFNWIAVACIVAACAVCWVLLIIVSPLIPSLDARGDKVREKKLQSFA